MNETIHNFSKLKDYIIDNHNDVYGKINRESMVWFYNNIKHINNIQPSDVLKNIGQVSSTYILGKMFMFKYSPETITLPYYDTYPLIFIIENYTDGFLGLNLHYLNPKMRLGFFNELTSTRITNNDVNDETRLTTNYKILSKYKKYKAFRPCIKRYKLKNIKSKVINIHARDWVFALFLPTERFAKLNKNKVWKESSDKI